MSRPKKMLPVLGQESQVQPEVREPEVAHAGEDGCADGCCCSDASPAGATAATPTTREANPEAPEGGAALGALERTVVRVEGMDCASCAATVERRVAVLPGVHRATVNFAAGRLDAEHEPGLALEEIERAVRDAGYGVAKAEEVERTPFWRTPRALLTAASALLFL
nr:heavy-metal-associated domain-containing protein [Actinomycetota bacterium]